MEERGSHNPEVVSSSLTTRIIFDFSSLSLLMEVIREFFSSF